MTQDKAFAQLNPLLQWISNQYPLNNIDRMTIRGIEKMFTSVVITHVLVGRLQNPNGAEDKAFVYAQMDKTGNVDLRTYVGKLSQDQIQIFTNTNGIDVATAARRRRDDIMGARLAARAGYIQPDEEVIITNDIRSNMAALTWPVSRSHASFAETHPLLKDGRSSPRRDRIRSRNGLTPSCE